MKIFYGIILLSITLNAFAQEEEGVDLLKAPSSPASQLLNISPNTIEHPTDLSSFWLSINNTTDGLSKFPTNYALDLSPAALFGKGITLKDLSVRNPCAVMWQSLVISMGIKQETDTITEKSFYKTGLGLKLSIVRPDWSAKTLTKYNELVALQEQITNLVEDASEEVMRDPAYLKLIEKQRNIDTSDHAAIEAMDERIDELYHRLMVEKRIERIASKPALHADLKKKAREFHIERTGPFLDFAGGFSAQFPTNKFNYSLGDRSGAWLTGGIIGGENNLSILGIIRYLYQPEHIYADPTGTIPFNKISTLDGGARLLYSTKDELFILSFESIYRSILNKNILDPSWKLNFSAEYDLGFNKKISISFGRDFDGVVSKGGNLIAALNLITGFGNKKALQ